MKEDVPTAFNSSRRLFNNCQLKSISAYASIWHANCESSSGASLVLLVHSVNEKNVTVSGAIPLGVLLRFLLENNKLLFLYSLGGL